MKVGQIVKVIDDGEVYPHYEKLYIEFGFPLSEWEHHYIDNNVNAKIVGLRKHHDTHALIACIKTDNGYTMIGVAGLEVVVVNPIEGYTQIFTRHTFARPYTKTGKPARYLKILECIKYFGPCSRAGIVLCLFDKNIQEQRSWYCTVFAGLNESGILKYNTKTRKWEEGKHFNSYFKYVEHCKSMLN